MRKDEFFEILPVATLATILGLAVVGGVGTWIGAAAYDYTTDRFVEEKCRYIMEQKENLDDKISNICNLENFNLASVEIGSKNDSSILRAFGATTVEEVMGIKQSNYVYLMLNISNEQAQKIVERAKYIKSLTNKDYGTSELNTQYTRDETGILIHRNINDRKRLDNCASASQELYNLIGEAFENAVNVELSNIGETSTMNKAYADLNPAYVGDISGYVPGMFGGQARLHATFVQANVMVTNISQTARDTEHNVSYFLIDSLQVRPTGSQGENEQKVQLESCRTKVEIEGANLSEEEVYAQFIAGNYKRVVDIVRKNVGTSSIVDHQPQKDVNEIKFLL